MSLLEQARLVSLDPEQIIIPFFDDEAGLAPLTMQWVGGDDFAIQGRQLFQQRHRRALFATGRVLLSVVDRHRLRGAVLLLGQGQEANVMTNHFAVQGQRLRQQAALPLQPVGEPGSEGFGIHAGEHLVEDTVAGNRMKASGALLERQAQPTALGLGQTGGKTGDLGDLPPPGQSAHRDQGPQHRSDRG